MLLLNVEERLLENLESPKYRKKCILYFSKRYFGIYKNFSVIINKIMVSTKMFLINTNYWKIQCGSIIKNPSSSPFNVNTLFPGHYLVLMSVPMTNNEF